MKVIHPIIFKFGGIKSEVVDESSRSQYLTFLKSLKIDRNISIASHNLFGNEYRTIPISKDIIQESPDSIAPIFINWCEKESGLITDFKIINSNIIFLIDLRGIKRDQQVYHISIALNKLLENEIEGEVKSIILLDKLPQKDDLIYKHIFSQVEKKRIIVYDNSFFSEKIAVSITRDNTKNNIVGRLYSRDISVETFRGKLVRRIGHFKSLSVPNICYRYFYDGRYCHEEIKKLTLEFILDNISNLDRFEYIFYISKKSTWLRESISALSGDLEADYNDIFKSFKGAYNAHNIPDDIIESYKGGGVLLITDILNTAERMKESISSLMKTVGDNSNLYLFSILNNSIKAENEINTRRINIGSDIYDVQYILDVDFPEEDSESCKLCKLNIDESNIENDTHLKFRSYDFWELSDLHKFEFEPYKPNIPEREKLLVPIFISWMVDNAPYLAYKFNMFLELTKFKTKLNFGIIYPDEKKSADSQNPEIYESTSSIFALKINEIFRVPIIGVPRKIIDDVYSGRLSLSQFNRLEFDWKQNISKVPPDTELIILDEFHLGGSTLTGLKKILTWIGKPAKGYFTIADFNPKKTAEYNNIKSNFHSYNLYEFDYN